MMAEPSKGESSTADATRARPAPLRSLATRFSLFSVALVFFVVGTIFAYDLRQDNFNIAKGALLFVVVLLVAATISRFTVRLLARPLRQLQAGITSVQNGRLEPVSYTHLDVYKRQAPYSGVVRHDPY